MPRNKLCTHCKCNNDAAPLSLNAIDDLIELFSKEIGQIEGSDERYLLHRPDLWATYSEIIFPDGLIGRRFTGIISRGANSPYDIEISMAKQIQIINVGGYIQTRISNGSNISVSAYGIDNSVFVKFDGSTQKLIIRSVITESRDGSPYDIWILYKK